MTTTDTNATGLAWAGLGCALAVPVILAVDASIRAPRPGGYYLPLFVLFAQPVATLAALWLSFSALNKMQGKGNGRGIAIFSVILSLLLLLLWIFVMYFRATYTGD